MVNFFIDVVDFLIPQDLPKQLVYYEYCMKTMHVD